MTTFDVTAAVLNRVGRLELEAASAMDDEAFEAWLRKELRKYADEFSSVDVDAAVVKTTVRVALAKEEAKAQIRRELEAVGIDGVTMARLLSVTGHRFASADIESCLAQLGARKKTAYRDSGRPQNVYALKQEDTE
ncbi:hypothetical protein [Streptomyces vinaceus]|uniref:hypothetical protein n=1 Tax=Streptomyces vinaceus TaxID=1960 RepID=UPI00369902F7